MKKYIKRLIRWIVTGIPEINITAQIGTLEAGKELMGKRIIVTGGSSGLGYSIAKCFIKQGANVIITGRNLEKLKQASCSLGENCRYYQLDNSNLDEMDSFCIKIQRDFDGIIDGVVCNAGISLHENSFFEVSPEKWDNQFSTNLKGTYFFIQKLLTCMVKDYPINIVIISSERGTQCDDIPYGLTKAALNSLTRGLSRRLYKRGIRVNAIAPGITASDMTSVSATGNLYQPLLASNRYFIPEEVAEVALFLMSDRSRCISGEIIATDAGNYISAYF